MTDVLRRAHPADDLAGGDPGAHDHARRRHRAADPRRGRRPGRLPGDGRWRWRWSSWSASSARTSAPATRPSARSQPGAGSLRDQLRIVGRRARLPAAAHHVRGAGARHRLHARRRRLPGRRRARPDGRGDDAVRLLRRAGAAAHPGVGGGRRPARQEARLRRRPRWSWPPARCWPSPRGRAPGAGRVRGRRPGRGRVRRLPGLPARDAARRRRGRRAPHRQQPGRRLHRGVDRGRDARPRARARASSRWCSPLGGYRSSTDGDVAQPGSRGHRDHARLLGAARRADRCSACRGCGRYSPRRRRGRGATADPTPPRSRRPT